MPPISLLKNFYYATFSSNLLYGSQVWGQSSNTVVKKDITVLQKKAVRITTFLDCIEHSTPIFKELTILKVDDNICVQNCHFVHDYFNDKRPKPIL